MLQSVQDGERMIHMLVDDLLASSSFLVTFFHLLHLDVEVDMHGLDGSVADVTP